MTTCRHGQPEIICYLCGCISNANALEFIVINDNNVFNMLQIEVFTCTLAAVMVCCVICVVFRTEDLRKNPLCVTPYGTGKSSNHMKGDFVAKNRRMMKAAMKRPYCNKQTTLPPPHHQSGGQQYNKTKSNKTTDRYKRVAIVHPPPSTPSPSAPPSVYAPPPS